MKILLTNDDGIDSPGLQELKKALVEEHEIWVIAPEGNRSGSSHSITLHAPIRMKRLSERDYSSDGSPADCVMMACMGFLRERMNLVISGINLGPNLGTDIVYSGTAAAARQAALMGMPALACSLNAFNPPFHLKYPIEFISRNLKLFCSLWDKDHFLNINFPGNINEDSSPKVTFPTRRIYKDKLYRFKAPNGDMYCYIDGPIPDSEMEEGSDFRTIQSGNISLSPILIHPANHEIEERYKDAHFVSL